MRSYDQTKVQQVINDIKQEIANLSIGKNPNANIRYSSSIKDRVANLVMEGLTTTTLQSLTGIPFSTLYKWVRKVQKQNRPKKQFRQLKIVPKDEPVVRSAPFATTTDEIIVHLADGIKLTVPLALMGSMIQILKEHNHVSRN